MKKIKIAIMLTLLVILILLIFLLMSEKKDIANNYYEENYIVMNENVIEDEHYVERNDSSMFDMQQEEKELQEYSVVTDKTKFYTLESIVQIYLNDINYKNYNSIYKYLSKEYLDKYQITLDNVVDFIDKLNNEEVKFIAKQMYWIEGEDIETYSIYGEIWNRQQTQIIKTEYYVVDIDSINKTFAITPCIDQRYNKLEDIKIYRKNENISKNEENEFTYKNLNEEEIVKRYYNYLNSCMINYPDLIYNSLDSEYKEKRFKTKDEFNKYIEKNKYYIHRSVLSEYGKTVDGFLFKDNYGKIFILKELQLMKFELLLDDYTIENSGVAPNYNKKTDDEKCRYNIVKFNKMINNKDYNAVYQKLNDIFRKNNFSDISKFEEYMDKNFYGFNVIEIDNISTEEDYIIYNCILKDGENSTKNKNFNIIMKLKEGTDFEMSFSFE